jgi:hypothetical protein
MSNDCATGPDYDPFMNLHGFREVLIKVDVIANEYPLADFDSTQAMKKRAQIPAPQENSGEQMQDPIVCPFEQGQVGA